MNALKKSSWQRGELSDHRWHTVPQYLWCTWSSHILDGCTAGAVDQRRVEQVSHQGEASAMHGERAPCDGQNTMERWKIH